LVSIGGFGKGGLSSSYEGCRLVGRESEPTPYFNTSGSLGEKDIFFSTLYHVIAQMINMKEYILLFTKNCISARIKAAEDALIYGHAAFLTVRFLGNQRHTRAVKTRSCCLIRMERLFHAVLIFCLYLKTTLNRMYGLKFCNYTKDFLFLTDI
jgi:hypothetical protein